MNTILLIITFIIMLTPVPLEAYIEAFYEKVHKISPSHTWTMVARGVLMLMLGIIIHKAGLTQNAIQPVFTMAAIHFAFFNYLYNHITGRKFYYLRNAGIDRLLQPVGWLGIMFFQVIILTAGVLVFFWKIV